MLVAVLESNGYTILLMIPAYTDSLGLKYGGPSATLNHVDIINIDNFGCDPKEHEAAVNKIAIIQESSKDCGLWVAASNAAKAGALAVLFYNSQIHDSLLSSPLLPQDWKHGDPLISIPVLSATRSVGLALLGDQSSTLLSIVTRNTLDETEVHYGDDTIIGRIAAEIQSVLAIFRSIYSYIIDRISSICSFVIDTISLTVSYVVERVTAAATWLWEYSKSVTLFMGVAFVPVGLNIVSTMGTKTVEFVVKGIRATVVAAVGLLCRALPLTHRCKAMMQPQENQSSAEETVVETVRPRGMPASERGPVKTANTQEVSYTDPIFNIYFVGSSFIVGLIIGACLAVAAVNASHPTPV
ncbi:hypothetical protein EC968_006853 [Mortierella alpina]|nr:hypothetical protein EC968_006853 [Mortierella alpina]